MVSEEIGLNAHLEARGIEVVETDLGEYIIQLRGERAEPHHRARDPPQQGDDRGRFPPHPSRACRAIARARPAPDLVAEARDVLREKFLAADVGITGANLLIAETGSSVIVTNEGNGDLTATLPAMHIVVASIEKIVPTLEDACDDPAAARRARPRARRSPPTPPSPPGRAATGDPDGPSAYHVVLLDNGRSEMLGSEFAGHAALHPLRRLPQSLPGLWRHRRACLWLGLSGADGRGADARSFMASTASRDLPNASSFCGRCEAVCPMDDPASRHDALLAGARFRARRGTSMQRLALRLWAYAAKRPRLYHALSGDDRAAARPARRKKRGSFSALPFAHAWTDTRDLPAPEGKTFHELYRKTRRSESQMTTAGQARALVLLAHSRRPSRRGQRPDTRGSGRRSVLRAHQRGTIPARARAPREARSTC